MNKINNLSVLVKLVTRLYVEHFQYTTVKYITYIFPGQCQLIQDPKGERVQSVSFPLFVCNKAVIYVTALVKPQLIH